MESDTTMQMSDLRGRTTAHGGGAAIGSEHPYRVAASRWRDLEITTGVAWALDLVVVSLAVSASHLCALAGVGHVATVPTAGGGAFLGGAGLAGLAAYASGLCDPRVLSSARDRWLRALIVGVVAAVGVAFGSFFTSQRAVEPIGPVIFGALVAVGLEAWRFGAAARTSPRRATDVVVVGTDVVARRFARMLEALPHKRHSIVGLVTPDEGAIPVGDLDGRRVLGSFAELDRICDSRCVDLVVIAEELEKSSASVDVLSRLKARGISCRTVGSVAMASTKQVPVDLVEARWLVASFENVERRGRRLWKRACDVTLGAIGLALFGLMLPMLWLFVKLDSPGPFFFSQPRIGQAGREFRVWKIRTMRVAVASERWASSEGHRITKLGALLRKLRIDEFPQFWNVLRGEMAIVGPRPEQPGLARELSDRIPLFGLRHLVKPGITGWAQVHHGYASSVEDSRAKLAYDLYYVHHYSVWMDLDIMLRTFFVMLLGYGAR